ncbi:uncharacterized protein N7496_008804 [Penicillium cataractarum]|uniref:DUF7582 domain-containing protein n=1 Tax=Penicillium cataractarum TaxID=2100454 RepID=A0A9W9S104_9EURO|nr:uncharacterized protein N7496_008804 [Penicillium cataractarum]KAJ5369044.1 hypothetical protein N7496_008804 [Penicillium cataractarum]
MGVMRFPRPSGIYVPSSPTRLLTIDMISPPLSPDFNFDSEVVLPSILPALEYISSKLQQKTMHVTLLVGRGKPYPTGQASDLMVIPITPLDTPSRRVLERAIAKGAKKFSLGPSWTEALSRSQHERHANEYLVQQSILQNEVIFSQEGLTLLNMDRIYIFKRRMCILSSRPFSRTDEQSMTSCVQLLHRIIKDFQGRPFSKAFFHRVYEQLDVKDDLLAVIATAYQHTYNQEAIVLPSKSKIESSKGKIEPSKTKTESSRKSPVHTAPIRTVRVRHQPVAKPKPSKSDTNKALPAKPTTVKPTPAKAVAPKTNPSPVRSPLKSSTMKPPSVRRGPKTPLSASDVTPITRNEWNILVGQDIRLQPTVTKWTPSPTVYAMA